MEMPCFWLNAVLYEKGNSNHNLILLRPWSARKSVDDLDKVHPELILWSSVFPVCVVLLDLLHWTEDHLGTLDTDDSR